MAIDCWSWIISSRPEIEPLVIEEMINAWQLTVELRLGMFSASGEEASALAKEEKDVLRPRPPPNIDAHRLWIKYLQERLDIAKHKSDFEIELFFTLMHRTLAMQTARLNDAWLSRHVSCVGLRFRFGISSVSRGIRYFLWAQKKIFILSFFLGKKLFFFSGMYAGKS